MAYNLIYSLICLVSSVFLLSLGLLSKVHYRATTSTRPFGILAVFSAIYAFGYAFEIMKGDPGWIYLWLRVEYIGLSFLAACWLWLSLEFTGKIRYIKPWFFILIFGISMIVLISVHTNNFHHLYYTSIEVNDSGPFQTAELGKGVMYIINSAWIICCLAISSVLYILHYLRVTPIFKKQTLIMLIGAVGSLAGHLFYLSGRVPWNLDIGPMIITVNTYIFAFGIFQAGLLDIFPIARNKVFESMKEGVIVTDLSGKIADFNPAAQDFLPGLSREWIGKNLLEMMPEFNSCSINENPFVLESNNEAQYYEIRQVPVIAKPGKKMAAAWYMRQITEQYKLLESLKNYAERDELTGIWNRRKWIEMAKGEIQRAERYKRPFAVMLIDVDHFKTVNDTMGHETGDTVLVSIVRTISDGLRDSDVFGRLGGEEFAVILPETDQEKAAAVSLRVLKAVSDNKIDYEGGRYTVTISAGIAVCEYGFITSLEELLRKADNALYNAKKSGRNRACFAEMSPRAG